MRRKPDGAISGNGGEHEGERGFAWPTDSCVPRPRRGIPAQVCLVFMDRRFDRGQYEALLMDHRPLDPREGFCVWGQRREHYQRGKRMRYGELPKQCRLVILKALMKDESVRHWF